MATTVPAPVLDARDEDALVAEAINALPSELSDRSASNPATVILEAAGYVVGQLQYALNRWPSAVIQKALALVGVTLQPARGAIATQSFTLSAPLPLDTVIPIGTLVSVADGSIVFATLQDLTIAAYTTPAGTIDTTAGSATVVGTGTAFDSSWIGRQIQIQGAGSWYTITAVADVTHLTISVTAGSTAGGAFYVGPVTGSTPAQATTAASTTNVGANKLTTLQGSVAGVASTTNAAAATGGRDIETTDEAIARCPLAFATREVAVCAEDYGEFARRTLGAGGRATAKENYNGASAATGYTSVACLSPRWTTATPVSTAERGAIMRDLAKRTLVSQNLVDVAATIYNPLFGCVVWRKSTYDDTTAAELIAAALNNYATPNLYPWGRTLYIPEIVGVLEALDCVDRVHSIKGVPCVGTKYSATTPAAINFAAATPGPHLTANTASFVAGQTVLLDGNAAFLITAIDPGVSITLDRAWTGAIANVNTHPWFLAVNDDMNAGSGEIWYSLPYSQLATATAAPSVIVAS